MSDTKFACPVCGHKTLDALADYDICPICYWEDDVLTEGKEDVSSPSNYGQHLSEAQANFVLFGASKEEYVEKVRKPTESELPDPNWKILPKAQALLNRIQDADS